jgi:AAA+ superfamily predicted ATPase
MLYELKKIEIVIFCCKLYERNDIHHLGTFGTMIRAFPLFDFPNNDSNRVIIFDIDLTLEKKYEILIPYMNLIKTYNDEELDNLYIYGTGKTYIVKAAVNELQKTDPNVGVLFFAPSPGDLKGKYVGETEKKIEEWFTCASRAACESQLECPGQKKFISLIFMDEFDAIAPDRNTDPTGLAANSVNTLLQMMDGIKSKENVAVVAATNFPWYLDSAILRRFDTQILIDLPKSGDITELLNIEMKKIIKFRDIKDPDA